MISFQQLEATQKVLLSVQNTILALVQLITKLHEANKTVAREVLKELQNADVSMRERLFILQVWRKYDQDTADKLSRRKAGEFLDPELAKVLEERKKIDRKKRKGEREKEKFRIQPKHSIYLGDGRLTAEKMPSRKTPCFVYDVFKKSGWIFEVKKSAHV